MLAWSVQVICSIHDMYYIRPLHTPETYHPNTTTYGSGETLQDLEELTYKINYSGTFKSFTMKRQAAILGGCINVACTVLFWLVVHTRIVCFIMYHSDNKRSCIPIAHSILCYICRIAMTCVSSYYNMHFFVFLRVYSYHLFGVPILILVQWSTIV